MALKIISNQVVGRDSQFFLYAPNQPLANQVLDAVDLRYEGPYWITPVISFGRVLRPNLQPAGNSSTPPVSGAFKAIRLISRTTGLDTYVAVTNSDCTAGVNAWATAVDDVSGTVPTMPTVTIPAPVLTNPPVTTTGSGTSLTNTFYIPLPLNPNSKHYGCAFPWFNGQAPATAFPTSATSVSALVTALNTAYSGSGAYNVTFSQVGTTNTLKAVSVNSGTGTFITTLGMNITLTPVSYSVTPPTAPTVLTCDGVLINGVNTKFPGGGITVNSGNLSALVNAITPIFESAATFSYSSSAVSVVTVQVPTYLTLAGVSTAFEFM